MNVLILRLESFKGKKDKTKTFLSVDLFDLDQKKTYAGLIADASRCPLPNGEIPEKSFFPALAEIEFQFGATKEGAYRPFLNAVSSWESLEIPDEVR